MRHNSVLWELADSGIPGVSERKALIPSQICQPRLVLGDAI